MRGFTLVELLVVIAIIGVLVGLLLPAVQSARAAARRSACVNKLKQLALAAVNHAETRKTLPSFRGGSCCWGNGSNDPTKAVDKSNNAGRRSGFIDLLPFMEESAMFDNIEAGDLTNAKGGPYGYSGWGVWNTSPSTLHCPADSAPYTQRQNSYAMCLGDSVFINWPAQATAAAGAARGLWNSGAYVPNSSSATSIPERVNKGIQLKECTDGLSKTLLFSERLRATADLGLRAATTENARSWIAQNASIRTTPNACLSVASGDQFVAGTQVKGRWGRSWTDGQPERIGFNTILPPNAPSCGDSDTNGNADNAYIVLPPTSDHPGGVNAAFGDGSVRFIRDNIDYGNAGTIVGQTATTASPYGVWGAMGTRAGGEVVSYD